MKRIARDAWIGTVRQNGLSSLIVSFPADTTEALGIGVGDRVRIVLYEDTPMLIITKEPSDSPAVLAPSTRIDHLSQKRGGM